ncbi:MAG: hypothetical protein IT529_06350 [Burkholderiales bacterium]|nr:hypothetical protein [Burkholderiales bacterium]
MARPAKPHPLGKCSAGPRLDVAMPPELWRRMQIIAGLQGQTPTAWARDAIERVIEGEWAFTKRRYPMLGGAGNTENPQETPGGGI